ncbi:MAG: hypothetical protein KDC98_22990, partial [Planctomycetes bacterium]|nr:hypothetical protein [Planctomycetota bacterium]
IGGDPLLNADPLLGPVAAPWLGFGPYLWTDGTSGRLDGLVWNCADVQPDGTHPSTLGRAKVAKLLQAFFSQNPLATGWYLGGGGNAAGFIVYGSGCSGSNGVPNIRTNNSLPTLGNLGFLLGVDHARPAAAAALLFSLAPADVALAGPCHLLVEPASALGAFVGVTSGNGSRIFSLPIPNVPGLVGYELFCQWGIDDPLGVPVSGLSGLALSRGARLIVGH